MSEARPHRKPVGLRIIGILKLISAILLFAVGGGIFHLLGSNLDEAAVHFIHRLHLDPDSKHVIQGLAALSGISEKDLKAIDAGTFFYAILYCIEGYGLLRAKHWAEYLTIIATASFIPLEIYELIRKLSLIRSTVFLINIIIVIYLIYLLKADKKAANSNT